MAQVKQKSRYYCDLENLIILDKHINNILWLSFFHTTCAFGLFNILTGQVPSSVIFFIFAYGIMSGLGITVGCHRYWTHKTFKAKLPLQILLAFMQTASGQFPIFNWCRDHRIHHKFVESDADPHDARRGFWFSHMGWLVQKEHPAVKEKEATIDLSDLDNDPVVRFQTKYYYYCYLVAAMIVPMSVFHYFWPQLTFFQMFSLNSVWYIFSLHFTWLVNSAAHMWGSQPYEISQRARDNKYVALLSMGEGWHNYHHTFPWDYRAAELGLYGFNLSKFVIDLFSLIGWAYDLKTVPKKVVQDRVQRTGDGSYAHDHRNLSNISKKLTVDDLNATEDSAKGATPIFQDLALPPWGWGDKDIPEEHYQITQLLRPFKAG